MIRRFFFCFFFLFRVLGDKFNLLCSFEFEYFYLSSVSESSRLAVSESGGELMAREWAASQFNSQHTKKLSLSWLCGDFSFHFVPPRRSLSNNSENNFNPSETMFFHSPTPTPHLARLVQWQLKKVSISTSENGNLLWKNCSSHADFALVTLTAAACREAGKAPLEPT